jgi:hypothetical protein
MQYIMLSGVPIEERKKQLLLLLHPAKIYWPNIDEICSNI